MQRTKGFFNRIAANFFGMMRDKQTPLRDRILIVLGIVYIISPIDLIPEGLFAILGYGDDLAVLAGTFALVRKNYKQYVERQMQVIDADYKWND